MSSQRNISILGGGESGTGAALLAKQRGWTVFLSDRGSLQAEHRAELLSAGVEFEEGTHSEARILETEVIVKSPGIPGNIPLLQNAREAGLEIVSEIEFASWFCTKPIVAITGTNGKTTTTSLLGHLLLASGRACALGGNLGTSFASLLLNDDQYDAYVLEVSSFQLDDIKNFRPHIALLLNITPDHLDRYEHSMGAYSASKFRIGMNQLENDYFLYCTNDFWTKEGMKNFEGKANRVGIDAPSTLAPSINLGAGALDLRNTVLRGRHNLLNASFATKAAQVLGLSLNEIQSGLNSFVNAPHRLESVAEQEGVLYINDSKATNVEAVFYALEAMERPVVWIAGGTDKGNVYDSLISLVSCQVKALVCLGLDNSKLRSAFDPILELNVTEAGSMAEAVNKARSFAASGDVVLLSPACASFDLFKNYEDRGNQFKDAVRSKNEVSCQ